MKGSYVLLIKVSEDITVMIGSLGLIKFDKGYYTYVGSGMNNLEKRVKRHLSSDKKLHWHIDYLLMNPKTSVVKVFYNESVTKDECLVAKSIKGFPVIGFGCGDCKCNSHLFKVNQGFIIKGFKSFKY